MSDNQADFTPKLWLLLLAAALAVLSIILSHRGFRYAAIAVAALALLFFGYSLTYKEWCTAHAPSTAFSSAFGGQSFLECVKLKGWLEL